MSVPSVCAVVVTYNRVELLGKSLEGLIGQTRAPDEILVVDNASTDETLAMLAAIYPAVVVHRLSTNTGASGGFSEGARLAHERGFDWVWLLDDDVVSEAECLEELISVAGVSKKKVVVPRRRSADGTYPRNEAVIDEATQSYAAPQSDDRWVPIDVFTFEGPLIHRSVIDRVGLPNRRFFIISDDTEFSVRVYKSIGPLAAALANKTAVNRLITSSDELTVESRWKRLIVGDATFPLKPDDQHWKYGYYLRNRHLIWKQLGWRRRRSRQILIHAGYIVADLSESIKRGWDWRLRLDVNVRAFVLGVLGRDGAFIDPAAYHAERLRRARKRGQAEFMG